MRREGLALYLLRDPQLAERRLLPRLRSPSGVGRMSDTARCAGSRSLPCPFSCEWGVCMLDDGHVGVHGWNPATESVAFRSWRLIEDARAEDPMMEAEVALILMQTPDRPEWLP